MKTQDEINFFRVKKAIDFIESNFKNQPSLDEIAQAVNVSPTHFQKLFKKWAGVSPKKFLQFISIQYAKSLLADKTRSLFDVGFETGLSSSGRLHDLFIKLEAMTPGQYKNGGENLRIDYSFFSSRFGSMLVASTAIGICHLAFIEEEKTGLHSLKNKFPQAKFQYQKVEMHQDAQDFMAEKISGSQKVYLHLKGTDFQLNVWRALLQIPQGKLSTYGKLAAEINSPKASRAAGTAIGSNPIAYIIPCHRVIQGTGKTGGYMWGSSRKKAILGWEAAQDNPELK